MGEFESHDLIKNADPEVAISIHEFHQRRTRLYDWLALSVRQNAGVFTLNNQAGIAVSEVSTAFVTSAYNLKYHIEEAEAASFLVADSWSVDEEDRHRRFNDIILGGNFQLLERPYVEETVNTVFETYADDDNSFIASMHDRYFDSLDIDVVSLLNRIFLMQEGDIISKTKELPLLDPEHTHRGVSVQKLKDLSREYAVSILPTLTTD